ncbi:sigma 54-interacting transcriptional regulator [Clostridium estertheticum]|uniref:Sigma 54-interacting transcriptional regulator n=2 Tax=Clostridium estertheticum TaxID=238834 RepID=A0A7Y3SSD0_9CLOT|nr:sigma 54-interacting transcriptional regulator [Clostridium estertheticum]NNU74438.1 sigma 54-interacting transcriptional regulator [Clostridium estertheticum]WBL49225.1 sigma 54-interacting transcriptional regulator [Clostridium estertheticum]
MLKLEGRKDNISKNRKLLNAASRFMVTLYEFLKGSGFFIVLLDNECCILKIIGDEDVVEEALSLNMVVGAYMSESSIGTTAMGIAIKEQNPIQISEKEHFIAAYQRWTCSAAPIHDVDGTIIGLLNLTGGREKVQKHTLGLIVSAVKCIENQINVEYINNRLLETYRYMNTVVDSIYLGIYVINKEGILKTINKEACSILRIKEEDIIGKKVDTILPDWINIFEKIIKGNVYNNIEVTLSNETTKTRYNVSANPIEIDNEVKGLVVVFTAIKKVIKSVNKYSSGRAIYNFEDIVGDSLEIKKVIEYAKIISSSPSTVLIQGESGTGKELLAQSIHNYGDRSNKTFIAINCGAISKNLIESELFGYEEGSFTGARRGGCAGKFELSSGGTLFLDEIGEMPLDMQVNLLRVLQEGYITRVGGDKIIPVDVRIIAATYKDLKKEVEKGRFREDLYYRLSVIPIKIPSLIERKGDLPILIDHLLKIKANKLNKKLTIMSAGIYEKMLNYNWPGNIRELENCIENIVNLNGESTMVFGDDEKNKSINNDFSNKVLSVENKKIYTLAELEKNEILKAMDQNECNMTKTAKDLGITRATLYSKIKRYNITR